MNVTKSGGGEAANLTSNLESTNPPTKIFFADLGSSRPGESFATFSFPFKLKGKILGIFLPKSGGYCPPRPPVPTPNLYIPGYELILTKQHEKMKLYLIGLNLMMFCLLALSQRELYGQLIDLKNISISPTCWYRHRVLVVLRLWTGHCSTC